VPSSTSYLVPVSGTYVMDITEVDLVVYCVDALLAVVLMCRSNLVIFIEPTGPNFVVPVKAQVQRQRPQQLHAVPLLSDRHFIEFGGLSLGQSVYVTHCVF